MQQKPERAAAIGLSQIEFETVQLGKAFERQQFEIADIAMSLQIREKIMPVVIPGTGRWTRVAAGYDFEGGVRRIAGEIFVGINLIVAGMIDRKQAHLV